MSGELEGGMQPLDAQTWFDSLRRLRVGIDAAGADVENHLRLAFYLANLAPGMFSLVACPSVREPAFEAMLASECYESAAMALMSTELSFELSWHADDNATVARVWFNELAVEAALDTRAAAPALLQAWVGVLLLLEQHEPDAS